jgi:molecular chaperone GrpE
MENAPETVAVSELTVQLEQCSQELTQLKQSYSRLAADFDNYKKRAAKDHAAQQIALQKSLFLPLLALADDFERALAGDHNQQNAVGFALIYKNLQKLLTSYGIKEMEVGGEFDPEMHEAVMSVADESKQSGTIVAVVQKGYLWQNEIIRPAKVSIVA